MATPSSYVREIKSIKEELKRTAERTKLLKKQQKTTEGHLYNYMVKHHIEEFEGIKAAKIAPKPVVKRRSKAQKRAEGVQLLFQIGVPDPETTYEEFLATQKATRLTLVSNNDGNET